MKNKTVKPSAQFKIRLDLHSLILYRNNQSTAQFETRPEQSDLKFGLGIHDLIQNQAGTPLVPLKTRPGRSHSYLNPTRASSSSPLDLEQVLIRWMGVQARAAFNLVEEVVSRGFDCNLRVNILHHDSHTCAWVRRT